MKRDLSGSAALLVIFSAPGRDDVERFVSVEDGALDLDQILDVAMIAWDLPARRLDVVVHPDGTSGDITMQGQAVGKWHAHGNAPR